MLLIITVVDWKYSAHIVKFNYLERICFVYFDYLSLFVVWNLFVATARMIIMGVSNR